MRKNINNNQVVLFEIPKTEISDANGVGFSKATVLAKSNLGLYAQRILRVCASQIRDDDPDDKIYSFNIPDFAEFFGLSTDKIHAKLRNALYELRSSTIILPIDRGRVTGYINWGHIFDGKVDISFDPVLKPLYQKNLSGKYPLRYIRGFAYSYTYRFYELFLLKLQQEGKDNKVKFYITIDELREWLRIEKAYKNYADIRKRIIIPIVADINGRKFNVTSKIIENDYCNLLVSYSEIKKGRKIVGIDFEVIRKDDTDIIEIQAFDTVDFEQLDEKTRKAYEMFTKWRVAQITITEAYKKFGAEGFYKIYLNVENAIKTNKVKNKTSYAAQCLRNGYMWSEEKEEPSIVEQKEKIKKTFEDIQRTNEINALISKLSDDDKQKIIDDILNNDSSVTRMFVTGKSFDELIKLPMGRSIVIEYLKKK